MFSRRNLKIMTVMSMFLVTTLFTQSADARVRMIKRVSVKSSRAIEYQRFNPFNVTVSETTSKTTSEVTSTVLPERTTSDITTFGVRKRPPIRLPFRPNVRSPFRPRL